MRPDKGWAFSFEIKQPTTSTGRPADWVNPHTGPNYFPNMVNFVSGTSLHAFYWYMCHGGSPTYCQPWFYYKNDQYTDVSYALLGHEFPQDKNGIPLGYAQFLISWDPSANPPLASYFRLSDTPGVFNGDWVSSEAPLAAQNTDPSGFTYTDALVVETGPLPDGYTTNLRLWNGALDPSAAPDDYFAPAPPPPPPYHVPAFGCALTVTAEKRTVGCALGQAEAVLTDPPSTEPQIVDFTQHTQHTSDKLPGGWVRRSSHRDNRRVAGGL